MLYRVKKQIHWDEALIRGITGTEITVAVLDTGITRHPDFDNRLLAFKDFVNHRKSAYDDSSHGTHVCGIIAGNGYASDGKYCGIAPSANLVVGKILDQEGDGSVRDMIQGIKWVVDNKERYRIRILNISVGSGQKENFAIERQLTEYIEEAWNAGILVVTAAGNGGPLPMSLSPIGVSGLVITVGCHDGGYFGKNKANLCENYSGRGPSPYAFKKPDIVAPGTDIVSCNAGCRYRYYQYENPYIRKSGTSMATPIVSGVCALAMQKYPDCTNDQIKRKLIYSAVDMNENWTKQGWGMVDIERLFREI